MNLVWMLVLLAWGPEKLPTPDSGVSGHYTLEQCHDKSLAFSRKHNTPIQLCRRMLEDKYLLLTKYRVIFDWTPGDGPIVDVDPEVERLKKALLEIGKWHKGKTKDSQRVRRIIRRALQE